MSTDLAFTCTRCGSSQPRYATGRGSGSPICKSCYVHDLTTPEAAAKIEVISRTIADIEPGLARSKITAAVERSASNLHGLSVLARQLESDPNVLLGSTRATKSVYGLVANLKDAGGVNVSLPRCSSCDREAKLTTRRGDGRICGTCYSRTKTESCSRCKKLRRVRSRTTDGAAICSSCHQRDPGRWELCGICDTVARVNGRSSDGSAICSRCYRQPKSRCDTCGTVAVIQSREGGSAVCGRCYRHPQRCCGRCGRTRRIYRRATEETPDLCHACWWEPIAICHRCGLEGMCNGIRTGKPLCLRCRLADKVDVVLMRDGVIAPELMALRDAIVGVANPRSGHVWIDRSPAVTVLRDIAAGRIDLSHESLDELAATSSLIHLRDLLIASGALPPRDPYLARLQKTVAAEAEASHPADAQLLRSFGTWRILRRARRKVDEGGNSVSIAKNASVRVREAARFLRWLREQGTSLQECTQADVDRWVGSGGVARFQVRDFITWAHEARSIPLLKVAVMGGGGSPSQPVDLNRRIALARRLLHDDTLDIADRVAGILVTIYAQPLARVARLTWDHVEIEQDVFIRLGNDPLVVPDPLGKLLRELPWRRQIGIGGNLALEKRWLFPGRQAGRPQHPEHVRKRLAALGINCRQVRNAALFELAREVPAAVLADMLGLHASTAVRWVERAGGNWTAYAAGRTTAASPI